MQELIESLDVNLQVANCHITEDTILFDVSSTSDYVLCPECKQRSTSVHDVYLTDIQDLPIQGKTVFLHLRVRRFTCQNPACSKKNFSEPINFRKHNARKTDRLISLIIDLAESRSSVGAARDLEALGILVKKSSLCNYLGHANFKCKLATY